VYDLKELEPVLRNDESRVALAMFLTFLAMVVEVGVCDTLVTVPPIPAPSSFNVTMSSAYIMKLDELATKESSIFRKGTTFSYKNMPKFLDLNLIIPSSPTLCMIWESK
jgi:hypothetical protein